MFAFYPVFGCLVLMAFGLTACAGKAEPGQGTITVGPWRSVGSSPIPRPLPSASTITAIGDADDVFTAVDMGTWQSECVVERSEAMDLPASPKESAPLPPPLLARRYQFKHVSGRIGVLEIVMRDAGRTTMTCSIHPLGDAKIEKQVLERTKIRLEDLHGVDVAPVRE